MPAFTVFCLSSHMEGLGTSLLDAMAFARPIVATAAGGIPEAVEDGVTGRVVPPRRPAALADALVEVLTDEGAATGDGRGRPAAVRASGSPPTAWSRRRSRSTASTSREGRRGPEPARPAWPRNGRSTPCAAAGRAGATVEVRVTTGPGDARRWAAEAARDGVDLLLVAGGDGTANEAAWGLLGSRTTLGLVPVGSGNGLARTLGIPLRPERALAASSRTGVPRRMDVGMVNERPFLNVAGAGFDAAVGAEFHARGQRGRPARHLHLRAGSAWARACATGRANGSSAPATTASRARRSWSRSSTAGSTAAAR